MADLGSMRHILPYLEMFRLCFWLSLIVLTDAYAEGADRLARPAYLQLTMNRVQRRSIGGSHASASSRLAAKPSCFTNIFGTDEFTRKHMPTAIRIYDYLPHEVRL